MTWVRPRVLAGLRGLGVAALSLAAGLPLLVLTVTSLALLPAGVGAVLVPPVTAAVRRLTGSQRRLAGEWFGVSIPVPYRPRPAPSRNRLVTGWRRCRWILTDPATWRDTLWLLLVPVGFAFGLLPAGLIASGVEGILVAPLLTPLVGVYRYGIGWLVAGPAGLMAPLAVVQGALVLWLGLRYGPWLLRRHAEFNRALLAPTRSATLQGHVQHLTRTRSDAVDAQAAELRRIERDLHDGAQARMVALGMSLGMAEDLIGRDPEAARRLLAEARQSSDQALSELRSLVRGIHPPVLAERGLGGAVQALALTLPIPVEVDVQVTDQVPAPIETAAYFAVAEALANVAKHSGAGRAWVRLWRARDRLHLLVGDDGIGGVDPGGGTGLRGVRRRLAVHDGTLTVASPAGGPTIVTMELACVSS